MAPKENEEDEFLFLQSAIDKAAKDLKGKKYVLSKDGTVFYSIKFDKIVFFF